MVLAELGSKISKALHTMTNSVVIDEAVLDSMIKTISMALLQADVDVKLVKQMQTNIKSKVNLEDVAAGSNKRKLIQTVVVKELFALLNPGVEAFAPKKGQPNVIMFVGLQGAGKTTTCTKYAYYWKRKGWKTALVCADTFRAGAYDQLKQNALKAKIPFYGSYTEQDPASVAEAGVEQFRKEKYDIIVVDTSGRHKQESALFLEMQEVAKATQPDDIVFVMDSSIGQAARDQAEAFKGAVAVGSVIITKLDGHAKGGGALSAVAATKSPICFVGTGEHMDEFEPFDTRSFVQRLLGMGDIGGLMKMFEEKEMFEQQGKRMQEIMEGNGEFTYRDMRDQFENLLKLGPLNKVMDMIPGFAGLMGKGKEQESVARIKRFMTIMDSMTQQELDSDGKMFSTQPNRLNRIARGAGVSVRHVQEVIETFKPFKKVAANMAKLGPKGLDPKAIMQPGRGGQMNMRKIAGMFNPQMLQKMGGIGNLQNMMKKFSQAMPGGMPGGKGGFGDLSGMGFPPGMMDDQ